MTIKNKLPTVVILVVNWNKKNDVLSLLGALRNIEYEGHEILIVDNASTDGSGEAIKEQYPEVTLIQNKENLGGTGGFNTGLRYVLKEAASRFDYIWLLDNDALVEPSALKELVKVAESDPKIGLAGSKIMNPSEPDIIVELGANINWQKGGVKPFLRNTRNKKELNDYYDVDYVAICSALVRVRALEEVGVLDERYFIFWDDMDWGVTFKQHGYRVVAVNRSVVSHPAFSEKGAMSSAGVYYGARNPLLMFSKHASNMYRVTSLFRRVRKTMKKISFFWAIERPHVVKLFMLAIADFLRNNWGGYKYQLDAPDEKKLDELDISGYKRFVIIPAGDKALFKKTIQEIRKQVKNPYIAMLVPKDRIDLFSEIDVDEIILRHSSRNIAMFDHIKTFITLLRKKIDVGVVSPEGSFGYLSHAVKNLCFFEEDKAVFSLDEADASLWKSGVAFILGEVSSYLVFPIVLLFSFRYKTRVPEKNKS